MADTHRIFNSTEMPKGLVRNVEVNFHKRTVQHLDIIKVLFIHELMN